MTDAKRAWLDTVIGTKLPPAGSGGPGGAAQPAQTAIHVPPVSGSCKAELVHEMAALDTLKPVEGQPDHYTAVLNGKQVQVDRAGADAVKAAAAKSLTRGISSVGGTAASALELYRTQEANNKDQWAVSAVVSTVQKIKTLGAYKDPGADVKRLVGEARKDHDEAKGALGAGKFGHAAALLADAEGKATQAQRMAQAWVNGAIDGAGTSITVLQHTRTASFAVVSGLAAVGTGGAAGLVAAAVLPTLSDVGGKALAGEQINWAGAVIDMAMSLLLSKFGGAAEKAVAVQVEAFVAKKLAGRFAEATVQKIALKVAETAGKQLISKGSELLKMVLNTVIARLHG